MKSAISDLKEIVDARPLILKDPEPVIQLHELADSLCNFVCRPWAKTEDFWTVYWDVTRSVKERFDAEGISIPFPQRDVHIIHENPSTAENKPAALPKASTAARPAAEIASANTRYNESIQAGFTERTYGLGGRHCLSLHNARYHVVIYSHYAISSKLARHLPYLMSSMNAKGTSSDPKRSNMRNNC